MVSVSLEKDYLLGHEFSVEVESFYMQKLMIITGITIVVIGLAWPWLVKLPLGRLPGDIIIDKPGMKVYIPVTTMILVSALISLLFWIFKK